MKKIKLTKTEAEKLAKYIEENKEKKLEHEQGEFELYLIRLEKILEKYNNRSEEAEEIEVDVVEFEAFKTFKGGL
ncbi:hypothetical protein VKN79_12165 (plasmid) [Fusobacterium polymorphum]|uniref:hypothetical protein n=1 Tax=Fusobacterium nucleatum subsp. polymorphum TaxID=76857 RepID=UPI002B4BDAE0|nr:hypothetical protein [Fusobacterium polymorphum]WRL78870.1 hypothetical protein VKN79_12165 [Fusobacterium polymorphum]